MIRAITDLKPGDILLYRPKNDLDWVGYFITFFSFGGAYCHAAIFTDKQTIIESHPDTGVVEKPLNPKWFPIIDSFRYKQLWEEAELQNLLKWFRTKIGCPYDLLALPSTVWRSELARIFGWKHFRKDRPLFNNKNAYYCSELVATGFYQAVSIKLCPGLNVMSTTPSDISYSKKLQKVIT